MLNYSYLFSSAIILIIIDSIYLSLLKGYFSKQVQAVQKTPLQVNIFSMIICYLFIIIGLNYFIIQSKSDKTVFNAFLLGIIIYGVYETTNLSIFTKWSWITVIIDTLWGGILFALTTWITKFITL
jgi:uncharacterized membrane protein